MPTINEQALELRTLRHERDEAKEYYESLDGQYKAKMLELYERMQDDDIDGIKVDNTNFVPSETIYANVQDRGAFVEWAKEHDDQLIEDKERKALINQLVRERLDNAEELPPGLGFYVRESISLRAAG